MVMPSGASDGNSRCTMALYEPLRSEPQIEITFKVGMTNLQAIDEMGGVDAAGSVPLMPRSAYRPRASRLRLVLDRVYEHADALDLDLTGVALLHPHRVRLARVADAGRRAGEDDVAGLERHALRDVGDGLGDREHHVVGVVRLHDLPVEPRLDFQTLAAGRQLVGGDHPRAETAGTVEILTHVPLRGLALIFAHRAFVAAGISGNARICIRSREVLRPLADDKDELGLVVERLGGLRPDDRLAVRHEGGTAAHEDGREFGNIVALRAFLDVFEIVEAEAEDFARRCHRQTVGQTLERAARTRGRTLGRVLERRQVAVVAAQTFAQIAGYGLVDRLQIDHLIALDHAEMQRAISFETDDFHGSLPRLVSPSFSNRR